MHVDGLNVVMKINTVANSIAADGTSEVMQHLHWNISGFEKVGSKYRIINAVFGW